MRYYFYGKRQPDDRVLEKIGGLMSLTRAIYMAIDAANASERCFVTDERGYVQFHACFENGFEEQPVFLHYNKFHSERAKLKIFGLLNANGFDVAC